MSSSGRRAEVFPPRVVVRVPADQVRLHRRRRQAGLREARVPLGGVLSGLPGVPGAQGRDRPGGGGGAMGGERPGHPHAAVHEAVRGARGGPVFCVSGVAREGGTDGKGCSSRNALSWPLHSHLLFLFRLVGCALFSPVAHCSDPTSALSRTCTLSNVFNTNDPQQAAFTATYLLLSPLPTTTSPRRFDPVQW